MCDLHGKIATINQYSKMTVPVSTTQGKMRLYLHIRVQPLALYNILRKYCTFFKVKKKMNKKC